MSDLGYRENIVIAKLNKGEVKTIIRGLVELLANIDASSETVQNMLEDNKRFLISLKEKMTDLLETFK